MFYKSYPELGILHDSMFYKSYPERGISVPFHHEVCPNNRKVFFDKQEMCPSNN